MDGSGRILRRRETNPASLNSSASLLLRRGSLERPLSKAPQRQKSLPAQALPRLPPRPPQAMPPGKFGSLGRKSGKDGSLASKLSKSIADLTSSERLKNWKAKLPSVRRVAKAKLEEEKPRNASPEPVVPGVNWQVSPLAEDSEQIMRRRVCRNDSENHYDLANGSYDVAESSNLNSRFRHSIGVLMNDNGGLPPMIRRNQSLAGSRKVYEEISLPKNPPPPAPTVRLDDDENLPPPARITPFSGVPHAKDGEIARPIACRPKPATPLAYFSSPEPARRPEPDSQSDTSSSIYFSSRPMSLRDPVAMSTPNRFCVSDNDDPKSFFSIKPRPPSGPIPGIPCLRTSMNSDYDIVPEFIDFTSQTTTASNGKLSKFPADENDNVVSSAQLKLEKSHPMALMTLQSHLSECMARDNRVTPPERQVSQRLTLDSHVAMPDTHMNQHARENSVMTSDGHVNRRLSHENHVSTPETHLNQRFARDSHVTLPESHMNQRLARETPESHVNQRVGAHANPRMMLVDPHANHHANGHQHQQYGSMGSHNSSGIHVTPSPSDSGIAELEIIAALKEKEGELASLRSSMEQNEQIIIRVYQEKEEKWQRKLKEWANRLEHSVQTEQRLLGQIQRLQDERGEIQRTVQNLTAEKHGLQRKCKEIESDLFATKNRMEANEKHWAICMHCGDIFLPHFSSLEAIGTPNVIDGLSKTSVPQKSPTPTEELRQELDCLKREVNGLRQTLQEQISVSAEERSRWQDEKKKVLEYQKMLQSNYVQVFERNKQLEHHLKKSSSLLSWHSDRGSAGAKYAISDSELLRSDV